MREHLLEIQTKIVTEKTDDARYEIGSCNSQSSFAEIIVSRLKTGKSVQLIVLGSLRCFTDQHFSRSAQRWKSDEFYAWMTLQSYVAWSWNYTVKWNTMKMKWNVVSFQKMRREKIVRRWLYWNILLFRFVSVDSLVRTLWHQME